MGAADEEKPRERAARLGLGALADRELVAIVLATSGSAGRTVGELATDILRDHGSLRRLATASIADLLRSPGIGAAKATALAAAFELGRRAHAEPDERPRIDSSERIAMAAAPLLTGRRERLVVLAADKRLRLLGIDVVSEGAADSAPVPVREILAAVLRRDGTAFALAHHHPGGDPTPSPADVAATAAVEKASRVSGLKMLDHVVLGAGQWRSVTSGRRTPD